MIEDSDMLLNASCRCDVDEGDEYDVEFNRMREATMKSRQVKVHEELEVIKESIEDLKKKLSFAKEQVKIIW
jgi:hypothetical protein